MRHPLRTIWNLPGTKKSLDEIADGDEIAVLRYNKRSKSITSSSGQRLYQIKRWCRLTATVNDIAAHNIKIVELEADTR